MNRCKTCVVLMAGLLAGVTVRGQLSAGLELGGNNNYLVTSSSAEAFTSYNHAAGISVGIPVQYRIADWFAVQSGLTYVQKNYQINRTGFFQGIYEKNSNAYVQLPVLGNISFGGEQLRGFVNLGMYAGYWATARVKGTEANILNTVDTAFNTVNPTSSFGENNSYSYNEKYQFNTTKDNRFELGWIAGAGISYSLNDTYHVFVEGRYTSSLTDQQKNYQLNQVARYNDTYGISVGCFIELGNKSSPSY